jgi:uncharacterized protein (DUF2267 family)
MRVTKTVVQSGFIVAGLVGAAAVAAPDTAGGRAVRRLSDRLARDVRYMVGAAPGILYRLSGRRPNPDVGDDVLADRVRSSIGPLAKKLDVPRVHVMVEEHVAMLHGDVTTDAAARTIEQAVLEISGIEGVESHLHIGLITGDTKPSDASEERRPPSDALRSLLDVAIESGASEPRRAVHAVLCRFLDRIPANERSQVLAHLPADVRDVVGPARRHGKEPGRLRTVEALVAAAQADGGIAPQWTESFTRRVLTTLRSLVEDEAEDVAAVLPPDLRSAWLAVPV